MNRRNLWIITGYTLLLLVCLLWPLTVLGEEKRLPPELEALFVLPPPAKTCVHMPRKVHSICTRIREGGRYYLYCLDKNNYTRKFLVDSEEA